MHRSLQSAKEHRIPNPYRVSLNLVIWQWQFTSSTKVSFIEGYSWIPRWHVAVSLCGEHRFALRVDKFGLPSNGLKPPSYLFILRSQRKRTAVFCSPQNAWSPRGTLDHRRTMYVPSFHKERVCTTMYLRGASLMALAASGTCSVHDTSLMCRKRTAPPLLVGDCWLHYFRPVSLGEENDNIKSSMILQNALNADF